MADLEKDSIDTLITDPPYGLSFMGKKWDYDVPSVEIWRECLRVLKPGATALIFAGSRTQHRMAINVEDAGFILKDTIMWIYGSGFPKSTDISKQLDKRAGKEREVIKRIRVDGKKTGFKSNWIKNDISKCTSSKAITLEAKLWDGYGTQLKPAYEPILVAMKPNDGTYAENALKHGVAGLNIDSGRIEYQSKEDEYHRKNVTQSDNIFTGKKDIDRNSNTKDRFPANIILDEETGRLLDEQSGILKSGGGIKQIKGSTLYGSDIFKSPKLKSDGKQHGASQGGASRFFYCAKASNSERNSGCKNSHPTVKPLKLIEYLCNLTKTPTGGVVLDPFAGSGTTGIACIQTERPYLLIEREQEYCEIIVKRVEKAASQIRF